MANSSSAKKRIRQNAVRRLRNRYRLASTRTGIKKLRKIEVKTEAEALLPSVISQIDRCAKHNLYHKNKAARLKSQLAKYVNSLS